MRSSFLFYFAQLGKFPRTLALIEQHCAWECLPPLKLRHRLHCLSGLNCLIHLSILPFTAMLAGPLSFTPLSGCQCRLRAVLASGLRG